MVPDVLVVGNHRNLSMMAWRLVALAWFAIETGIHQTNSLNLGDVPSRFTVPRKS